MSLNIKNPRTHQLAREVAQRTGETMTEAISVALEERLARLEERENTSAIEAEMRLARMMVIVEQIDKQLAKTGFPEVGFPDVNEFLYDELGLPK